MLSINRRAFVQLSSGAALGVASNRIFGLTDTPSISNKDGQLRVTGSNYTWEYLQGKDTFKLRDSRNRLIVSGTMQPAVVVAPAGEPTLRQCTPGMPTAPRSENGRVTVDYEGVNGCGRLSVTWRFDEHGIWTEPIVYDAPPKQDVVSLHYFADVKDAKPVPSLHANYLVVPGISESDAISPILRDYVSLNESVWLGRGSLAPGPSQQWGLWLQHRRCKRAAELVYGGQIVRLYLRLGRFAWGRSDSSARFRQEQPVHRLSQRSVEAYAWAGPHPAGRRALLVDCGRLLQCDRRLLPGAASRGGDSQVSTFREKDSHHADAAILHRDIRGTQSLRDEGRDFFNRR